MLILDASNILHAARAPRSGDGVAWLLDTLETGRYAGLDITIVCDGVPGAAHPTLTRLVSGSRSRRVLYAAVPPHDREADDVIEHLLHDARHPTRLTIVSSDRRLRDAAKRAGARTIGSREFLGHLHADTLKSAARKPDEPLDPGSVRWWLAYFESSQRREDPGRSNKPRAAPKDRPQTIGLSPGAIDADPEALLVAIEPEDLDMERWLKCKGVTPPSPPPPQASRASSRSGPSTPRTARP
jgi:hypothetical protein